MSLSRSPSSPLARARRRRPRTAALAAVCAAALLAADCSGGQDSGPSGGHSSPGASEGHGGKSASPSAPSSPAPVTGDDLQRSYKEVVDHVLPSVVQITTSDGLGSGVVYDTKGHIVTNAHVVGGASDFQVTLATGKDPVGAELVSSYPDQDLAVIKLKRPPRDLHPARFDTAKKAGVGDIVLAMGNPLGLSSSVTQGIVSAVGRTVNEGRGQATLGNMVQTSAAVNSGNSGGALVNLSGHVIGIPTLSARDPQLDNGAAPGIGFAIPATTVRKIAGQMIEHGRVTDADKAALGVKVRTVLDGHLKASGVAIVSLTRTSAAGEAGLKPGDVLEKVGSEGITDAVSLTEALASHQPGDKVEVIYQRDGRTKTAEVTLGRS